MTSQVRVLIVEDDDAIATALALNLRLAGHLPSRARDGDAALSILGDQEFDLVLLDINLPKRNGLDVLTTLRTADLRTPVIVLSAREGEYDKVAALKLGADDYVTKPFALAELLARLDAVLRRARPAPTPTPRPQARVRFADAEFDVVRREAWASGKPVKLTHLEFELLVFFVSHPGQIFDRTEILRNVWQQSAGTARTVDNFVGQLRRHFEVNPEAPRHFVTVRGSGYRFDP